MPFLYVAAGTLFAFVSVCHQTKGTSPSLMYALNSLTDSYLSSSLYLAR